ncbi:MAG: C39 family peptidase [Fimbriimonadaceae bacterium]
MSLLAGIVLGANLIPSRMLDQAGLFEFDSSGTWTGSFDPEILWDELVVSWNCSLSPGATLQVKVCPQGSTKWYSLGTWANERARRTSTKNQVDELAKVDTDTLILKQPSQKLVARLELSGAGNVEFLTLSFRNKSAPVINVIGDKSVWGKVLEAPMRAQMSYPDGKVICSATATSMALGYWSKVLNREVVDQDVPLVCEGVFDKGWDGTGNWAFNTAYAGTIPGMRAYVARLWSIEQLERWIARDIPVVCSVSYDLLRGKGEKGKSDGHLVVLVGFTPEGDPVFNDPGKNVVRMTYKRADFRSAWQSSGNTCYLIYPQFYASPENRERCWLD